MAGARALVTVAGTSGGVMGRVVARSVVTGAGSSGAVMGAAAGTRSVVTGAGSYGAVVCAAAVSTVVSSVLRITIHEMMMCIIQVTDTRDLRYIFVSIFTNSEW